LRSRTLRRIRRMPAARRVRNALVGRPLKGWVYRHVLRHLPLRRSTVVFESHLGKQYSDNPKAIYEYMVAEGLRFRAVWSYASRSRRFPSEALRVRRDSWRYYYEIARAGYIVENQGLPSVVVRRAGQRYVQTWHGTSYKHMGTDLREVGNSPARTRALHEAVARWDDFVVQSDFSAATLAPALGVRGRLLRTGYPRNDRLHKGGDPDEIAELRERLRLPPDRRIVLYAPTYRRYPRPYILADPAHRPRLDIDRFEQQLGDDWFLLVRAHYLDRVTLAPQHRTVARNVSRHDDIADLLLCADVLLTDFSSTMFDFPVTGRPIGFFAPDLSLYRHLRGAYFDLEAEGPGPVLRDTDEVIAWLDDVDAVHKSYGQRYADFQASYLGYETGTAAQQIVRAVFGDRLQRPGALRSARGE
jgi:CDP-glycerol glycerophosphotransferase